MRQKRFLKFIDLLKVSDQSKILDVGGAPHIWVGSGFEENITILNLLVEEPYVDKHGITYIKGDACNMEMIEDNGFDIAYSNSVIEHVGDFKKQKRICQ